MALDYKLIGKRLKNARIKKGYTQDALAEIMDVSIAYLSRIENRQNTYKSSQTK